VLFHERFLIFEKNMLIHKSYKIEEKLFSNLFLNYKTLSIQKRINCYYCFAQD